MSDPVTKQELVDAGVDSRDLGKVVNDAAGLSPVTTRLGQSVKNIAKVIEDVEVEADAAIDDVNQASLSAIASIEETVGDAASYNDRGAWVVDTYVIKDLVQESGITYVCTVAHASSPAFQTDLDAGKWGLFQTQLPEKLLSGYASLAAAVTSIGALATTLVIDKDDTLTASQAIPNTITLRKIAGYKLATSTFTLTCNAWIEASGQLFDISGGGSVVGPPMNREVDVVWFGAGLGLGDDAPLISAAFDFANRGTNIDSLENVTNLVGYSKEYHLNTSLVLGETAAVSGAVIKINGEITTNPALPYAIKLRHFKQPEIKLGRIAPTSASANKGVIIENTFEGSITINQIGEYDVPLTNHGDGTYGFQGCAYYTLRCGAAGKSPHTSVVVESTTSNNGYVSSLFVEITDARGVVFSKHTEGVAQAAPFHNIQYVRCGLEHILNEGFVWEKTHFCAVLYPRLEQSGGSFSIGVLNLTGDCEGNTFEFFQIVDTQIGTLTESSIVKARIMDVGGVVVAYQASETRSGRIYHSDRTKDLTTQNLTVFTYGDTVDTSLGAPLSKYRGFFKDSAGVTHPYGLGTPYASLTISSYTGPEVIALGYETTVDLKVDSGALEIRSHANRQDEGMEIILNVRVAHTDLTFASNDGTLPIAKTAFPTAGVYMIKRIDFRWRVTQIGNQFATS